MGSYSGKQFPLRWGDEGVDVSRDEFIKRIGGKDKTKRKHIGTDYDFNKKADLNVNSPGVRKYICMVGKCSGVIDEKPQEE